MCDPSESDGRTDTWRVKVITEFVYCVTMYDVGMRSVRRLDASVPESQHIGIPMARPSGDLLWTQRHRERGFSRFFGFPCYYQSTIAPYSFIHLPPTMYTVFLPVLRFSPVSTIPPLLHTHSFIYHPHYITFFSQYFSFPLSVSFHHCSILIYSSAFPVVVNLLQ